jgi:hypothetical protein
MINGNNLLLYKETGFWEERCHRLMPDTHFLIINEMEVLGDIIGASSFPSFTTDTGIADYGVPKEQIAIPITDAEACVTYYFVCKEKNRKRISELELL